MNGFNEFKKQRLAELAKKDKGSATSALPAGVSRAIDAAKAGQNPVSSFQVDDKKEKSEVITPNARNYDSFKDFKRDFLGAKAGIIEFKSGAYNHGVDFDYLTSLDKDIGDFFKEQDEALKNNPFGDTAASDAADAKIAEFRERLANVVKYRMENAKWLEERELGNYRHPMEVARKATALASGEPITDFSIDMNVTPGVKRDESLEAVDAFISGVNAQLNYVEDAWNNAKVTYIEFGGDEAAYKDALMRSRHEYETFDEVKAALANPGRVSRMSAEELEYLSNYGLRHGYSDPAEYDKEIAELWGKIEFGGAEYGKGTDIGKVLRRKIESLEAARDRTAAYNEAWRAYTPFFNAEDFEAQSQYRGGGGLLGEYINLSDSEITALMSGGTEYNRLDYLLDSDEVKEFVNLNIALLGEEEISMYNYLVNTQGEEAAKVFLNTITPLVAERTRENNSKLLTKFAKEHPIIGTGVSFLTTAGSALLAPGQLIANIFGAEDVAKDLGILADVTGILRGGASEYVAEDLGLGGVGQVGYNVLTNVVDMLIARKLAGLTAGAGTQKLSAGLTQAIMSSEAASSTMADANRRGLSGLQVAALGVSSAAIEWLTEKYSIEALMSEPKTALGYWAKNFIAEGSEEAVSEIVGDIVDRAIAGDKSETMMRYLELVEGGMDPKEASHKVLLDNLKDVGLAALTGALAGGIQAGPATISFKKSSLDNGRIIKNDGGEDILIREALKLGEGSEAYELALAAQEKLSAKGKLSSSTLGNIVLAGGEELVTAYEAAIESKRGLADYEAAVKKPVSEAEDAQEAFGDAAGKKPVSEAEDVQEAFDDAEVREAAEREKAPIIDLESNTAPLGNPNVRQQLDINEFSGDIRAHMDRVMRLAKVFGKKVNFYAKGLNSAGKVENGFRNPSDGSINVNVYAKNPYAVVFGHELVHWTENAKSYSQLQTAVERYLNKKVGKGEFAKRANAIIDSRKGTEWSVTLDGAYKEVVANFLSRELFQNEEAVMRFVEDNRSVGQRILEAIRSMLRKVTKGKAGYGSLKDAERLFAKALRQTETAEVKRAKEGSSASSAEKSDAYLIDGKKANAREISADLGRRLKAGEITSEDYDELFEKYVASSPEFRGEVEGELMGIMDSTEAVGGGIAQEKQFSVEDVRVNDKPKTKLQDRNFDEDKYYSRQIDRFDTLKQGGYITVGKITQGSPLDKIGIPSGNLYFDVSKIFKEMRDRKDAIPPEKMKEIPKVLDNPIVITEYVDKNGVHSANVYGNLYVGSSPLVIGIMIARTPKGNVVSKVQTVHPNRNVMKEMQDDNILYLSENKKETKSWFQSLGTQKLPLGGNRFGFIRSISQSPGSVNRQFSVSGDENYKEAQLQIIESTNPAPNTYSTWIRTAEDIKTLAETLEDSDWVDVDTFNPDLTRDDILKAIKSGKIKIYSSYPIENGVFVSPSYMEAESYSGDGQVYAKNADIRNVAWIDPTQGQYAEVFDPNTGESAYKRKSSKGQALNLEYEDSQQPTSEMLLDSNATGYSISQPFDPVNRQFSVSGDEVDSQGRKLSEGQIEYFKDSKVRDENGALKVMYHGTPNGDFTVFKDGTYFTENKWYADLYQNPGASSISYGKSVTNPKTYEVYLDIKKPFDISDPEARSIYINDYIKGGNAAGINPYLSDDEYDKINSIDWTEGEDLREFLKENDYDYDGLVLDEGATGGYGEDVKYRGKSYVIFDHSQVKNVDNVNPTSDPDIRFSVSGDDEAETLAAVEAQGRDLLDSHIESEPPAPVEHEYDENDVNLPTTDYLRGRIVGYDSVRDALDALAKGRLSKEKGVELAKLIGMPELDGEVVVPFRTWVTLDSLPMYNRRDTGELVPVAGYALPSPNMMGLWVHYYDAQHRTHSNEFFTWDEITKTKAQHIPTKEEIDSYNEWLDENSQLVPESTVPTAEEQREINEIDHLFISEEESAHAEGVFEALPTRAKSYVNRALKGFKVRIADIFGVPYTRLASSGIAEAGNAIVSDYLNNGGGFNEEKMGGIFEKLLDNLKSVDSSFYEQYQGVLRELREVKGLAISKGDASSIPGGLTAFNKRSNGRIGYVGLLENKRKKGSSFIPVDTFYQGMSEKYPELFPAEIVNPADQLERLLAEAKEIRASRNLAFEVSKEDRKYLLSEFRATLGTMTHPLSNAIRYNEEASEDGTAEDVENAEDETRRFIKNGIKAQKLLPKIKKLEWQLLLTDHDKAVVGDLLSGYVTEDAVREREANAEEILTMYHARQPYEKLAREMKEYKKKVIKEQLRNAEEIVGDVSAWRDKKKFGNLRYNLIDFRRILRDIAPDEETAERAIRYYEEPIRRHSAEAVRYIQKMRDRVKALDLSRKVRDGDAISESAAVQLLGEIRAAIDILEERMKNAKASAKGRDTMTRDGQTLEQWKKDEAEIWVMNKSFSDPAVKARIERGVEEFTKIYDEIHDSMNMALAKVVQQPIPKRAGYFPHFEKEIDMGFIAKARRLIGIGSEVSPLPTEIAGRTGDFRPNKEYFANAMKRMVNDRGKQKETVLFDAVEGFDRYVEAAARQIYYTEDIVKLRSLDRYFRTAAGDDGIKTQIERIQNNGSSEAEQQILIDHIMKDARYQMSGFVQFLTEYTNKLAGKKSIVDRGIESLFGRDVFNISKAITKKYAINATSSLSSALTNFLPWAQGSGGYSLRDFWLGAWQLLHGDGIVDDSVFATARQGSTRLVRSKLEIAGDWSRFVFEFVDRLVATTTVQARYNYNIRRGLSNDAALSDADAWSAALIGDRSRAMQPLAFESHNPLVKVLTQFQLEVNNNILRTFKDIPRDLKTIIDENDTGAAALKITNYITKTAIYTWVLNEVMERIVGRGPGGDFLGIIFDAIATGTGWDAFEELLGFFGLDDEDEEEEETGAWQAVAGTAYNIAQEIPFVGGLLGGGRVPIASLFSDVPRLFNTFTDKEASWQYKAGVAFSELSTPLLYLTMPFGASQIKKSGTALIDWSRGGSYGYDKEGNELLKYPVAGGGDLLSGLLFGPTATEGGREWIESGFGNLGRKGTEAYKYAVAAGADEQEAWELVKKVKGLKSKDDPSEDASKIEQVAYLDSLDVDDEIKAGIYRGLIATEDKEGAVKDAEAELFDRCTELGITEGKLYRVLSDIRLLKNELREAGEEGTTAEVTEFLINAELLESAKPAVYSQIVSFSTFEKLYSGGIPKDQAEEVAYEIACLTPVGKNKSVTEVQKASVVLKSGLPEETAAQFIDKDTREKLSAVSEYGASVRGYVALKEYLLYNDEDGGAPSMEEARKAINAISRGSVVSVPGMPDVALELTSSEKAALWQMMNSAWKPEKNPFSTSVGRKVYNALNALKEEEE